MDLWEGLGPQSQTIRDEVVGVGTHPRSPETQPQTTLNNIHIYIYTYGINYIYLNIVYKMYIDIWVECLPFLFKWIEWHLTGRKLIQKSPSTKSRPCFSLWGSKDLDWQHHCIRLNNKGEERRGDQNDDIQNSFHSVLQLFRNIYRPA